MNLEEVQSKLEEAKINKIDIEKKIFELEQKEKELLMQPLLKKIGKCYIRVSDEQITGYKIIGVKTPHYLKCIHFTYGKYYSDPSLLFSEFTQKYIHSKESGTGFNEVDVETFNDFFNQALNYIRKMNKEGEY